MNLLAPGLYYKDNVLTPDQISKVLELARRQPESKWVYANTIAEERGVGNNSCNYHLLFDRVLTEDERVFLRSLAPSFPDAVLQTQVINRYPVGGFLCDHTDRQSARYNTIIPLQNNEDGLRYYTQEEGKYRKYFLKDVAGRCTVITDSFLIHGVPVVRQERYVLIAIYVAAEEAKWNYYGDMYQNQP